MEKAGLLIERLFEQYSNKASKEQLRITAQLLLCELEKENEEIQDVQNVVSVFFPSVSHFNAGNDTLELSVLPEAKQTVVSEPDIKAESKVKTEKQEYGFFDPMVEIPTLALKQQEVNEAITAQQESLNDKLKSVSSHKDIGSSLKEGPIKDLRKAIGINDQYLFINELFRGDQIMYDRSIKTINSFNIYGEAELWIKRELKLKLGWNENSDAVHSFDQLIKRRFS
jgi:hypothetical protein